MNLDKGREAARHMLNADDRTTGHVLLGIGLVVGAALLAGAVAEREARKIDASGRRERYTRTLGVVEAPKNWLAVVAPALLSATTLSAVRVWNAPAGPQRSMALGLWAALQALNTVWMATRPRRTWHQVVSAMSTAGLTAAYASHARKLDKRAATIVAPQGGGVSFANMLGEKFGGRKAGGGWAPTLH
ncbi:MAG TPA: tryptophan-rich sensory protein [Caulobacteraceae bacterium]|jgi:hypothetical protein